MDAPNALAAPLWQDMQLYYNEAANHGVSLATIGGGAAAIVEYDNIRFFGDADESEGSADVEVFAFAGSNDLVFAYDNVTGGIVDGPLTIGTENSAGHRGHGVGQQRGRLGGDRGRHRGLPDVRGARLRPGRVHLPGDRRRRTPTCVSG